MPFFTSKILVEPYETMFTTLLEDTPSITWPPVEVVTFGVSEVVLPGSDVGPWAEPLPGV